MHALPFLTRRDPATGGELACPDLPVPEGRPVTLPGRGTTWVREVRGPEGARPVVLLHGLAATGGLNWETSFGTLGERFRVVSIDHRGHGRGIRTARFRLEDCADDVAALITQLNLKDPIIAGYSMGGPIATLVWRRHPHLVGGLVLCATSRNFRGSPGEKLAFGAFAAAGLSPVLLPQRALRHFGSLVCALPIPGLSGRVKWGVDELAGHDPKTLLQAAGEIGRFNAGEWTHDIDVPTAVLAHTRDQVVPVRRQIRLAQAIPGATLYEVPAGHAAVAGGPEAKVFATTLLRACENLPTISAGADRQRMGINARCAS